MILYIDSREPKSIITYIRYLNENSKYKIDIVEKPLDIGDYLFYNEKNKSEIILIERKSLNDLESSIKDGRYSEQSIRLNSSEIHNHNIYYLIEGNIINYKNRNFKPSLYSSLISLSYYKGFSILNTVNNIETAELIHNIGEKLSREKQRNPYYINTNLNNTDLNNINLDNTNLDNTNLDNTNLDNDFKNNESCDYLSVIKINKKSNITKDNINIIMLMQIPSVSFQTAEVIMDKYKTIKNLILELEKDGNCLSFLKLKSNNRKISKTAIESIKKFLLEYE